MEHGSDHTKIILILPEIFGKIFLAQDNSPSVGLATGRKHFDEFRIVVSSHLQLKQMRYILKFFEKIFRRSAIIITLGNGISLS